MEYLDKENMANVDQKQEKIGDERKIMRKKKKKLYLDISLAEGVP